MASDTGAPWLLPYPEDTDLVRDGASDIEALAVATAAGLSAADNAGIGSNVVQAVMTDTFTNTSSSPAAVTGLSVTITPTSATSKILVLAQVTFGLNSGGLGWGNYRISGGNAGTYIGDAAGSRARAVFGGATGSVESLNQQAIGASMVVLDAPATTDPTTYSVEVFRGGNGQVSVNRSFSDSDGSNLTRGASSIVAIEVAV